MTKTDFFRLIIKIFGMYSLVLTLFTVVPNNINFLIFQFDVSMIVMLLAVTCISFGLFFVLLFRTDSIINFLKLDKGFDENRIDLGSLTNQSILKLAVLIIGGFLIINYLPGFLYDAVSYFKNKTSGDSFDFYSITVSFINVLVGYLIVVNYQSITNFLDNK